MAPDLSVLEELALTAARLSHEPAVGNREANPMPAGAIRVIAREIDSGEIELQGDHDAAFALAVPEMERVCSVANATYTIVSDEQRTASTWRSCR